MEILRIKEKELEKAFLKRVVKELKKEEEVLFQKEDKFFYIQESTEGGFDVNVFEKEEDIFDEDEEINFDLVVDGGVVDTEDRLDAIKFMF